MDQGRVSPDRKKNWGGLKSMKRETKDAGGSSYS